MRNIPFTVRADLALGARVANYLVDNGEDVIICEGEVPDTIPDVTAQGIAYSVNASQMLLKIPNGVNFLISEGVRITYERNGASDRDVSLFLLGSAWGALCYQRCLLPMHASAVIDRGAVHAFTGPSGAGKSTLAAALSDRGFGFFTDDVLIIDPTEIGGVTPCYSGQKDLKLWKDALKLTQATKMGAVRETEDFQKFFAVPNSTSQLSTGPLCSLSILTNHNAKLDKQRFSIERISGANALKQLRDSIYRPGFAHAIWGRQKLFQTLSQMIAGVEVQSFDRPMLKDQFDNGISYMGGWIENWRANGATTGKAEQ